MTLTSVSQTDTRKEKSNSTSCRRMRLEGPTTC